MIRLPGIIGISIFPFPNSPLQLARRGLQENPSPEGRGLGEGYHYLISFKPTTEPKVSGLYFIGAAKPLDINPPQTHDSSRGGFLPERRSSNLLHHLIQNLVRAPVLLLIDPQAPFQSGVCGNPEARRLKVKPDPIVEKDLILVVRQELPVVVQGFQLDLRIRK